MIPPLEESGLLPPGQYVATWLEISRAFGTTPYRLSLLRGLRLAAARLKRAGCTTLYLDGSFVTGKQIPADFDACWDPTGVVLDRLDPVLKVFVAGRVAQKAKYGGELFPSTAPADPSGATFLEFFQRDRDGAAKGLILLDLRSFEA